LRNVVPNFAGEQHDVPHTFERILDAGNISVGAAA
jgi:hypothetical protein